MEQAMSQSPVYYSHGSNVGAVTPVRPPSLEDRLDHLRRQCDRLSKVRGSIAQIADRIELLQPEENQSGCASPPASDLNAKFGETIGWISANLDEIENLVRRIENSLFSGEGQQTGYINKVG
jgi:hypothetical protein